MIISLKNKKALVGGASQGLGKAIASQLAASGASVTIMARNEEKLKAVVDEMPKNEGQKHQYIVVDFSDFEHYKIRLYDYFKTNTVDILINNTNGPKAGTVLEKTDDDYLAAFNMIFQTVQFTTSLAIPHMKENGFGKIINLTSRTVREPADNLALSNTIRAAVVTWGKTLSRDVAKYNITVNNILTGNFDTERLKQLFELQAATKNISPKEVLNKAKTEIPMLRLGRPEEMANLVTFLASEQASYITGATIPIDGGLLKSI
ncbi:MAG: SDR family oxidoreductase [Sphingobacteriales bacterium]|jgi:3-oxoacyl-[acyl-carrier protein] reductase|nr:SDR family oxidoreductase [Sphingobacteriales bacterium]